MCLRSPYFIPQIRLRRRPVLEPWTTLTRSRFEGLWDKKGGKRKRKILLRHLGLHVWNLLNCLYFAYSVQEFELQLNNVLLGITFKLQINAGEKLDRVKDMIKASWHIRHEWLRIQPNESWCSGKHWVGLDCEIYWAKNHEKHFQLRMKQTNISNVWGFSFFIQHTIPGLS